jgi:RNA polymerase sigma-70 factor, ECF subfamily
VASDVELVDLVDGLEDLDQRTAFVLTQLLGFTYAEAAESCGVPVGTIRSRVARARHQLIGRLEEGSDPVVGRG